MLLFDPSYAAFLVSLTLLFLRLQNLPRWCPASWNVPIFLHSHTEYLEAFNQIQLLGQATRHVHVLYTCVPALAKRHYRRDCRRVRIIR